MKSRSIEKETLRVLRSRRGKWAVYENQDMGHSQAGHLQFLKVGKRCTFKVAPERMPDTERGLGWRYVFIGFVNLKTGKVQEVKL